MISIKVGIVLLITDGFTGLAPEGKGLVFVIDGVEQKVIQKPGGYYVFINVPKGTHEISIKSPQFEEETLHTDGTENVIPVCLKPGIRYPFRGKDVRVKISLTKVLKEGLWIGHSLGHSEIKIAQTEAKAGSDKVKLFFDEGASKLSFPHNFLIDDGENTEICLFESFEKEYESEMRTGSAFSHKRGCALYPAQHYETAGKETLTVVLNGDKELVIFSQELKKVFHLNTADQKEITVD